MKPEQRLEMIREVRLNLSGQKKVVKEGFPIPSPSGSETESEYISRCNKEIYDEFPDNAQRNAVCYTKWRESMSSQKFEAYPWEECISDQIARYGDEEIAKKVCGAIKAGMKKSFEEGEGLESACWPGYTAIGLKPAPDGSGRMVPNCVEDKGE